MVVVIGGAAGVDRQRHWWFAVANGAAPSSSSILCFSFFSLLLLLLFFFFWSSPSLLCSCSLLFSLFFSSFSFSPLFSCFYRQKNRGERLGWCSVLPPSTAPPTHGKCFWASGVGWRLFERESMSFWRERWRWQRKKKSSSSPISRVEGKKKTHGADKTAPFWSLLFFFSWTMYEMAPFWTKRVVSFKRKRRQKCVRFHIGPQSVICSIKS